MPQVSRLLLVLGSAMLRNLLRRPSGKNTVLRGVPPSVVQRDANSGFLDGWASVFFGGSVGGGEGFCTLKGVRTSDTMLGLAGSSGGWLLGSEGGAICADCESLW